MTDNMKIWDALGKTDPSHTKGFSRAGGFKGTATKPMWVIKRLTEQFGPVGVGWGTGKPTYETVHAQDGQVLVYCTLSVWHTTPDNEVWGVGGDKAIGKNKHGLFYDDEAYKKAFTDAMMNGFKSLGVAADIHMGMFEDSKYVETVRREFAEAEKPKITDSQKTKLMAHLDAMNVPVADFLSVSKITDLSQLPADKFEGAKGWITKNAKQKENA